MSEMISYQIMEAVPYIEVLVMAHHYCGRCHELKRKNAVQFVLRRILVFGGLEQFVIYVYNSYLCQIIFCASIDLVPSG